MYEVCLGKYYNLCFRRLWKKYYSKVGRGWLYNMEINKQIVAVSCFISQPLKTKWHMIKISTIIYNGWTKRITKDTKQTPKLCVNLINDNVNTGLIVTIYTMKSLSTYSPVVLWWIKWLLIPDSLMLTI